MKEVSIFRLYFLRTIYLLIAVGLAFTIWPQIIYHPNAWSLWHGVGCSLLGAVSILAALGIRYPLAMLPILFLELIWKSIWLIAIAFPMWTNNQLDTAHIHTTHDCLVGIILLFAIPWPYVWAHYVKKHGDRWR